MTFFGRMGRGQRTNRLDFGGNLDYNPDPGFLGLDYDPHPESMIFKGFFMFYCDSYRQQRIKHEHPWRRFVLYRVFYGFFLNFQFFLFFFYVLFLATCDRLS